MGCPLSARGVTGPWSQRTLGTQQQHPPLWVLGGVSLPVGSWVLVRAVGLVVGVAGLVVGVVELTAGGVELGLLGWGCWVVGLGSSGCWIGVVGLDLLVCRFVGLGLLGGGWGIWVGGVRLG